MILRSLLENRPSYHPAHDYWYTPAGFGAPTAAGVKVSEATAMNCMAVSACVRILAETAGMLPIHLYKRWSKGIGKDKAVDHACYDLVRFQPNRAMPAGTWKETQVGHKALWGNSYSAIIRNARMEPVELLPLRPDLVKVKVDTEWNATYEYRPSGQKEDIPASEILHDRWFSRDGFIGMTPIGMARQGIGLALACEEHGARFFSNNATPAGALKHPGVLGKPARDHLRESWSEVHGGLSNSSKIAILEEGLEWQQIGMPNADAEFLSTRRFQDTRIAGFYRIPPHMIGELERATFTNIEHQSLEFVVYTMMPWLVSMEEEMDLKLLTKAERAAGYFFRYNVKALLRGDVKAQALAHKMYRHIGALNGDEIRNDLDKNPVPDGNGEGYWRPANIMVEGEDAPAPEPAPVTVAAVRSEDTVDNIWLRAIGRGYAGLMEQLAEQGAEDNGE